MADRDARQQTMSDFYEDKEDYEKCMEIDSKVTREHKMRSCFELTPTIAIDRVLTEVNYDMDHPDCSKFLDARSKLLSTSLLIEEFFRGQRIAEKHGTNECLKEERAWASLIEQRTASTRHKYIEVPVTQSGDRQTHTSKEMFYPSLARNGRPAGLTEVASYQQKVKDWFAPNSSSMNMAFCDIILRRYCKINDCFHLLGASWLAELLNGVNIVVRNLKQEGPHLFNLGPTCGHLGKGWVAEQVGDFSETGEAERFFHPCLDPDKTNKFNWMEILNLEDWAASEVRFIAPARLMKRASVRFRDQHRVPGRIKRLLAMAHGDEKTFLEAVADCCFGSCTKTFLRKLATFLGAVGPKDTLWEVLETLLRHIYPDITELRVTEIIMKRMDITTANIEQLLDVDDVLSVMSPDDQVKMKQEQEKQLERIESAKELHKEFARRRAAAPPDPAYIEHAVADQSSKSNERVATHMKQNPKTGVPQSQVKRYVPPGAYVWKDVNNRKWHCHLPPHKCFHTKWADYGEGGAAWELCRQAWALHCRDAGLPRSMIPVRGIFDAFVEEGSAGATSSADVVILGS